MSNILQRLKKIIKSNPDLPDPKIADLGEAGDCYIIGVLIDKEKFDHFDERSRSIVFEDLQAAACNALMIAEDTHRWYHGNQLEYSARVSGIYTSMCNEDHLYDDEELEDFSTCPPSAIQKRMKIANVPQNIQDAFQAGVQYGNDTNYSDEDPHSYRPLEHGEMFENWLQDRERENKKDSV